MYIQKYLKCFLVATLSSKLGLVLIFETCLTPVVEVPGRQVYISRARESVFFPRNKLYYILLYCTLSVPVNNDVIAKYRPNEEEATRTYHKSWKLDALHLTGKNV